MKLRMNFIKDSELRHPGSIKPKTAGKLVGLVALALLAIIGLSLAGQRASLARAVVQTRKNFKNIEPVYKEVALMQKNLAAINRYRSELEGWARGGLDCHAPLMAIEQTTPLSIQLRKLWMSSNLTRPEPDKSRAKSEIAKQKAPPLQRRYAIAIDGLVGGARSEETVVRFVRELREHEFFAAEFEDVRLQGLKSTTGRRGEISDVRMFGLEMLSKPREMK